MKNTWKWILGIAALLLVLFALPGLYNNLSGYGMMAGTWNHSMMGGMTFNPLGGFFMGFNALLVWGVSLGLLTLAAYGLLQLSGKAIPQTASMAETSNHTCPACGKASPFDQNTCPHCGEPF